MKSDKPAAGKRLMVRVLFWSCVVWAGLGSTQLFAAQDTSTDFFESKIRPVLIEHCYQCHNSVDPADSEFALDWRKGIRATTEHGTGVVPGKPEKSLLFAVINHRIAGLEMPDGGVKLDSDVIADFKRWIADGAPDPRDEPPTEAVLKSSISWEATLAARKKWWSFQPIQNPEPPPANGWSDHPVDRFIYDGLKSSQLRPNSTAQDRVLTRRISYALTGLPPSPGLLSMIDSGEKSTDALIDELLASPQFGERWARHWMDLVRYSDSHGSEGDPDIPNAYQYRDYLIRALNADVSYRQLVREHVAGDLLETARVNEALGINESAIGPAHWRLCFHGFAPTDALDEKVRFTDDQINVFGKAFLGLTISCARCHDHKFDPISQTDYYALFGIVGSCRPAMNDVSLPARQTELQTELASLKGQIKSKLVDEWLDHASRLSDRIQNDVSFARLHLPTVDQASHSLSLWRTLRDHSGDSRLIEAWKNEREKWTAQRLEQSTYLQNQDAVGNWELANRDDFDSWFGSGSDSFAPVAPGEFTIGGERDPVVTGILPAGVYSNLLSNLHRGVLGSPRFSVGEKMTAWMRCRGGGQATARYVVQNYPRSGTVYPIHEIKDERWHWQRFDLGYWDGDQVHLEIATALDAPLQTRNSERSWFGIRDVVVQKTALERPPEFPLQWLSPVFETAADSEPTTITEFADILMAATIDTIEAWRDGTMTDQQALFLDALVRDNVLPNDQALIPGAANLVNQYREMESRVPVPYRVPGVMEADAFDQPLFERGNHHQPTESVRRRFLEAIDPTPYQTTQSGRLELADDLFRHDNPLTSRVIVNRIWLNLFGQGLVSTPDNFGRMGAKPSHPELLDYLATRMVEQGWSIKKMIRFLMKSKTWQQSSDETLESVECDPENRLFSRFQMRRLDAEAIRDSIVFVSGRLNSEMYGPGFAANSRSNRRAIYVRSKRNSLDKFLSVFDAPVPFATTGKRNVTNVPAQSLAMLNSTFVIELANSWADEVRQPTDPASVRQRIESMFESAIARRPSLVELDDLESYYRASEALEQSRTRRQQQLRQERVVAERQLQSILDPIRRSLAGAEAANEEAVSLPTPLCRWDFSDGGVADSESELSMNLFHTRIVDGALVLDGNGFALSDPISKTVTARTLATWLQLGNLDQTGGGVMTIQDLPGDVFDAIVFAELKSRHWLSGSDFHRRTLEFGGPEEMASPNTPVHVAIVYAEDGSITCYRNGEIYGRTIKKSSIKTYTRGQARIGLGIRHGNQTTPGRMLEGKIFEARLYDVALTSEQVAASFSRQPFVSEAKLLAELSPQQVERIGLLKRTIVERTNALEQVGHSGQGLQDPLTRVAHAIFNLKEFVFIR